MCYVRLDIFQIWLVWLMIAIHFGVQRQDATKSKNECITNNISEFLKFSNPKNLEFSGKYIVCEHWNLPLRSQDNNRVPGHVVYWHRDKFQRSPTIYFPKKSRFFRFENFGISENVFVMHSFFDFLASYSCTPKCMAIINQTSQIWKIPMNHRTNIAQPN